jgi:5-methylcytosine-specific restriction endonuclease McrA
MKVSEHITPARILQHAAAAPALQRKSGGTFAFHDQRQSAVAQRKLVDQAIHMHAGNSPAQLMDAEEEHETESEHHYEQAPEPIQGKWQGSPFGVLQLMPSRDNFNADQRRKILAKNKKANGGFHTCVNCGFQHALTRYATRRGRRIGDGDFHVDHIIAASRGGRALMRNGRVFCGTCNTSRGNRANAKRTGMSKWRALHRKNVAKNYLIRKRKY